MSYVIVMLEYALILYINFEDPNVPISELMGRTCSYAFLCPEFFGWPNETQNSSIV